MPEALSTEWLRKAAAQKEQAAAALEAVSPFPPGGRAETYVTYWRTEAQALRLAALVPELREVIEAYLWGQPTKLSANASRIAQRRFRLDQGARYALSKLPQPEDNDHG